MLAQEISYVGFDLVQGDASRLPCGDMGLVFNSELCAREVRVPQFQAGRKEPATSEADV